MVSNYIQPIILVTKFPCLKTEFILSLKFIVIIGQLIQIHHKVLKKKRANGIIIFSLNRMYI
jgi:hypothetical protein